MSSIFVVIGLVWTVPLISAPFVVIACRVSPTFKRRITHHLLGSDASAMRHAPGDHDALQMVGRRPIAASAWQIERKHGEPVAVYADRESELV